MTEERPVLVSAPDGAGNRSGVLARKYRPETFAGVIGQQAVVRMLRNALTENRVAQALVFSGVRGTGKTTLARIVAKGLNCLKSDAPTDQPCGECQSCQEIAQGNSLDVQEIDAASHTGVDHIRDLIGSVSYRASGRFKVYILDEVHMLSTSAFNALLKTLEEPPAHVRFIFATTEIRKIPATVLSRTQRFNLRRVENDALVAFFAKVIAAEGASAEIAALEVVARAAQGSVRDGLSLLDQFLSGGERAMSEGFVRAQLGLSGTQTVQDVFSALLNGDGAQMLKLLDIERAGGGDPLNFLRDLLEICHQLSRHKVLKDAKDVNFSQSERALHGQYAHLVSMPHLARLWQVLLKGAEEVRFAPEPSMALEMVMIRAHFLSSMPTPQQILTQQPIPASRPMTTDMPTANPVEDTPPVIMESPLMGSPLVKEKPFHDFASMLNYLSANSEIHLAGVLRQDCRLQSFIEGKIILYVPKAERKRVAALPSILLNLTGDTWLVEQLESEEGTEQSLSTQIDAEKARKLELVKNDPTFQAMEALFPNAQPTNISG